MLYEHKNNYFLNSWMISHRLSKFRFIYLMNEACGRVTVTFTIPVAKFMYTVGMKFCTSHFSIIHEKFPSIDRLTPGIMLAPRPR